MLAGDFAEDPIAAAERCLGSWQNEAQRQVSIQEPTPAPAARSWSTARIGAG